MPEVPQPGEGYANLEYKLVLPGKRVLTFDPARVVISSADLFDSVYEVGKATHLFQTADANFLESVRQMMSDANPVLEYRLGFGTPNSMYWLPWQRHIIVRYSATFLGIGNAAGHRIAFATANEFIRLERSNKVISRKGTISEIVRTIAEENNLKSVVEPTDGKFMMYQTFVDDIRFIRDRLLGRAVNRHGRGGYYFFLRDNVLHFHTPDFQSSAKQMDYYSSFGSDLTVIDNSQDPELWDSGLAGIRITAHDPYTGQTREIQSDAQLSMRLADSIYEYGNVNNGEWNMPYHLSENPPVEVNALAQFKYQRSRQQTFRCGITLDKTISIRHGDLLNIGIAQQNSVASSFGGYHYVTSVAYLVKKKSVKTICNLERGEIRGQDQALSGQNAQQQLIPESKAPGQLPNILEIQSSESTKGAGKQSGARTFTVVSDPDTGKGLS